MTWVPVDVGESGRRAKAFFRTCGLGIAATDAGAAGHALACVLEAFHASDRASEFCLFAAWCGELIGEFPDMPSAEATLIERARGEVPANINHGVVAFSYVRSTGNRHVCGGTIFDHERDEAIPLVEHEVWIGATGAA